MNLHHHNAEELRSLRVQGQRPANEVFVSFIPGGFAPPEVEIEEAFVLSPDDDMRLCVGLTVVILIDGHGRRAVMDVVERLKKAGALRVTVCPVDSAESTMFVDGGVPTYEKLSLNFYQWRQ